MSRYAPNAGRADGADGVGVGVAALDAGAVEPLGVALEQAAVTPSSRASPTTKAVARLN
jgi:hypothetical protein